MATKDNVLDRKPLRSKHIIANLYGKPLGGEGTSLITFYKALL